MLNPGELASPGDWAELSVPWRTAYEQAWESYRAGSFGIGACITDPTDQAIVAKGRNRIGEPRDTPGVLAGNFLAHAEMNALAVLEPINARGLHLYTTLEPCLMCAATAILMNVAHVHFAVDDEFFAGLDDLWPKHGYTAARQPAKTGPFSGPLAAFGRLLPISVQLAERGEDHPPNQAARAQWPELFELARDLPSRLEPQATNSAATAVPEALSLVWDDLVAATS